MLRVANSTPIVDFDSKLNSLRVKRDSKLLLPTPESPISTTAKSGFQEIIIKANRKLLTVSVSPLYSSCII